MPELITKSEYARRRGCDKSAVTRAVQNGWITEIDGKIDPVVADVQWAANARSRTDSRPATALGAQLAGRAPAAAAEGKPPREDDYFAARARRETAEAELSELKLQETLGQLVRADTVRAETARLAAALRESILQLPARLTPVLAAESDPAKLHDLLERELHQVLAQLTQPPAAAAPAPA